MKIFVILKIVLESMLRKSTRWLMYYIWLTEKYLAYNMLDSAFWSTSIYCVAASWFLQIFEGLCLLHLVFDRFDSDSVFLFTSKRYTVVCRGLSKIFISMKNSERAETEKYVKRTDIQSWFSLKAYFSVRRRYMIVPFSFQFWTYIKSNNTR